MYRGASIIRSFHNDEKSSYGTITQLRGRFILVDKATEARDEGKLLYDRLQKARYSNEISHRTRLPTKKLKVLMFQSESIL